MREPQTILRAVKAARERDYVDFWPAGTVATGRFRCTACGNDSSVKHVVPACPQCGERLWERADSAGS